MRIEIQGREFEINPPKLGQMEQIAVLLAEVGLSNSTLSVEGVLQAVGEKGKLAEMLAIAVSEQGVPMSKKDVTALTEFFRWEVGWADFLEYLTPFFGYIFTDRVRETVRREVSLALSRVLSAFAQTFDGSMPSSAEETVGITPESAGN
ncbi:MAG: hypothetical protein D6712_17860 [Chloroflexi bacterium]|nr:MAG: hypothetical protein D6712_17860 [Chloroflexota bacterium]